MKMIFLTMLSIAAITSSSSAQTVSCEKEGLAFPLNNAEIIQRIEGKSLGFNIRAHVIGTIERSADNVWDQISVEDSGRKVILFSQFRRSLAIRSLPAPQGNEIGKTIELCGYVNIVEKSSGDFSMPIPKGIYAFTTWTSYSPSRDVGNKAKQREDGFVKLDGTLYGARP